MVSGIDGIINAETGNWMRHTARLLHIAGQVVVDAM